MDVDAWNPGRGTALHAAAYSMWEQESFVRLPPQGGAIVNAYHPVIGTALWHIAAGNRHMLTVHILLEKGADFHREEWGFRTPLHEAAKRGRPAIVLLLLERGADINVWDPEFSTPLHAAVDSPYESKYLCNYFRERCRYQCMPSENRYHIEIGSHEAN